MGGRPLSMTAQRNVSPAGRRAPAPRQKMPQLSLRSGVLMLAVRRLLLVALLAVCAIAAPAAPAAAAPRKAPPSFFGVMFDGALRGAPLETQQDQFDLMARSGVESVRWVMSWEGMQFVPGGRFDYDAPDRTVRLAAERNMTVLPVLLHAPRFARLYKRRDYSPPRLAPFQSFLRAVVRRYGSNGRFWIDNPDLTKRPIRHWQIWNEPNTQTFWDVKPAGRWRWPIGYARLLKASNATIKRTDRRAKVVTAGIVGSAWTELARLYKLGLKGHFDTMAVHVYPQTEPRVLEALRRVRAVMLRAGDRRGRIFLTETAFPSSRGQVRPIKGQRQETKVGMARRLKRLFRLAVAKRRALALDRLYWYTWASGYRHPTSNFEYAGLLAAAEGGMDYRPQPALRAFRNAAARYQGCRKDVFGRCR